ncbi:uncharacterized protein LOC115982327 isoform X2 [Quercus lobata]|uniref:uncharacterized protein LOC115982327 isoform X2 n=1 Tax=Quercus lobata TaxID=97700 RepID=UPI0012477249|nr:uncharacterized protein LOC115982327 isoform X2 [Quercus lobata]
MSQEGWQIPLFKQLPSGYTEEVPTPYGNNINTFPIQSQKKVLIRLNFAEPQRILMIFVWRFLWLSLCCRTNPCPAESGYIFYREDRWSSNNFYILSILSIPWSSIQTTKEDIIVGGAGNRFMVLATVVESQYAITTVIINPVRNYPLGCTIPCIQSILLFSFLHGHIHEIKDNFTNANSVKNIKMYTLIGVPVATSTFTSHSLL